MLTTPKSSLKLWTPIANAFEAFRRRLIAEPFATYEHIWRLLHIEESLVVTAGAAIACRLNELWEGNDEKQTELNHLRKMITGLPTGDEGDSVVDQNCLTGSIDAWINVLQRYAKPDVEPECAFCEAAGVYFTEGLDVEIAFIESWNRIAPVPEVHRKKESSRLARIRAMNGFRNKLAHVPISHKALDDIYRGIRTEIIRLLSPDDTLLKVSPRRDLRTNRFHTVLRGAICNEQSLVTGSDYQQIDAKGHMHDGRCFFQWSDGSELLSWNASPFACLDEELKVMLLFRINGLVTDPDLDEFQGEYHRFAAEIEPVRQDAVSRELLTAWFPHVERQSESDSNAPLLHGESDSSTDGDSTPERSSEELLTYCNSAIRTHDFANISASIRELFEKSQHPVPFEELRDWTAIAFDSKAFGVALQLFTFLCDYQQQIFPDDLRDWAELAFQDRKYHVAKRVFDELELSGNDYKYNDVARLKHGTSIWHVAEDTTNESIQESERVVLLKQATDILEKAADHVDTRYSARALYQQSKAFWHLWKHQRDLNTLKMARSAANRAALVDYDPAFVSWYDRIERDFQRALEEQ